MKKLILAILMAQTVWAATLPSTAQNHANAGLVKSSEFRRPKNDADLKKWLQNMVWCHHFTTEEIKAATGLSDAEIKSALTKFKISPETCPARDKNAPLLVLPYPGGRHPRTANLDKAIDPQRETKVSIFAPWNDRDYVVVDVPEAIFSNLGVTYLAHIDCPTIWTQQGVTLPKLEWTTHADGSLTYERKLPNGISFGAKVVPTREEAKLELWLHNGTKEKLTGLRMQVCTGLKGMEGFDAEENHKILNIPYAASCSREGNRWVITSWEQCPSVGGTPLCPCIHADAQIADCEPGKTKTVHGWLSFYEGMDIQAELKRKLKK